MLRTAATSPLHFAFSALTLVLACGGGAVPPRAVTSDRPAQPSASGSLPKAASLADARVAVAAAPATPALEGIGIEVKNPSAEARVAETIGIRLADVQKLLPSLQFSRVIVQDERGAAVLSQLVDSDAGERVDELVFQTDLAPNQSRRFVLGEGTRSVPSRDQFKVYGRFARERHDDFAWENDRVAHRVYGSALETWAPEPLTSSGVDIWVKRTPRLVINDWYQSDDYHRDNGEGVDFYSVGPSRGCGVDTMVSWQRT